MYFLSFKKINKINQIKTINAQTVSQSNIYIKNNKKNIYINK